MVAPVLSDMTQLWQEIIPHAFTRDPTGVQQLSSSSEPAPEICQVSYDNVRPRLLHRVFLFWLPLVFGIRLWTYHAQLVIHLAVTQEK